MRRHACHVLTALTSIYPLYIQQLVHDAHFQSVLTRIVQRNGLGTLLSEMA